MFFEWEIIILSLYFFWFLALTFLFLRFYNYYRNLTSDTKKQTLNEILNELFRKEERIYKDVGNLVKRFDKLEQEGMLHVQKIGLLRFNPFKDTGGDQSFILAILDAHDTGVVISSLHTRSGTRWYAKKVVKGKGVEYNLSDDEKKAVSQARVFS